MNNEILDEIRRVRDEIAKECDYDIYKLSQRIREGTEKFEGRRLESCFAEAACATEAGG